MKSLLGSTAIYLLLPLTAFAADLPKRNTAPVAPIAATTWTGFYFGANAGVGFDRFSADGDKKGNDFYDYNLRKTSVAFGLQGGYNYQINNIVVGVEADITAAPWMKKVGQTFEDSKLKASRTAEGRINAVGSLRGRIGFAFDKTLVYATAGVGVVSSSFSDAKIGVDDKTKFVAVGGVGVEQKLTSNISAGVEGLMFAKSGNTITNAKNTRTTTYSTGNVGVVRAKLNFSF